MANVISATNYQKIAKDYSNVVYELSGIIGYLYDAVNIIAVIPDVLPTADLFSNYYSGYTLNSVNMTNTTPLLPAVKALNSHVLNRSGYTTIDAFLEANSITVPQGWAELSALNGITISSSNISG